jgi:arylsulfatase
VNADSPNGATPFDENAWELYNLNEDFTERVNLARRYPEKVAELRTLFEKQAQTYNLYPLITWDDVRSGKVHRTPGSTENQLEKLTQHSKPAP